MMQMILTSLILKGFFLQCSDLKFMAFLDSSALFHPLSHAEYTRQSMALFGPRLPCMGFSKTLCLSGWLLLENHYALN